MCAKCAIVFFQVILDSYVGLLSRNKAFIGKQQTGLRTKICLELTLLKTACLSHVIRARPIEVDTCTGRLFHTHAFIEFLAIYTYTGFLPLTYNTISPKIQQMPV